MNITLTSDFGEASPYVPIWKGALLQHCPAARLVDLSHDVAAGEIFDAALLLRRVYFYYPAGTLHMVGLDPGQGPDRLLLASAGGQLLLALDNGVLGMVLEREPAAEVWAVQLCPRTTFVARDVMAPLAGRLAQGVQPKRLGVAVSDWRRLGLPRPQAVAGNSRGEVLAVDRFGNLISNFTQADLRASRDLAVSVAGVAIRAGGANYAAAPPGELAWFWGAEGWLEICAVGASAAARLGAVRGTPVEVA
ncbi:MAG: SAM hydrolase/SAM-dependent halogenase family protein, partial [Terriglobales bacterium]